MAGVDSGGIRARRAAPPMATAVPAKPVEVHSPTTKERAMAGLFASLALGCVGLIAIGGANDFSGLSLGAVALFIVGPVAYGGLVFSMKQMAAFFCCVQQTKDSGATGASSSQDSAGVPTEESQSAGAAKSATNPAAVAATTKVAQVSPPEPALAPKAVGSPATAKKEQKPSRKDNTDEEEPCAWDLIADQWDSLPSLVQVLNKAMAGILGAPEAVRQIPAEGRALWQWLTRQRWKPYPWVHLPDSVAFTWGVLEILFIAPILAVEILITVPLMEVAKAEWRQRRFAHLRALILELVRSVSQPLGRLTMRDPRNHSYLPWMLLGGVFTPLLFLWALRRHSTHGLEFSTLVIYHLLRVGPRLQIFAHIHTLAHKEGHNHKGFFRGPFSVLNCTTEWWIGPFYGVVPWNYYIAHNKIHHRWHNDVDDVHTNLDLDRTNPLSFFLYVPRFTLYWTGLSPLALFIKRREWTLIMKLLYGMVAYYGVAAILFWWSPSFCTVYWLFPHMEACVLLCAISYLWHAFVEESDPGNQYVNSVTILDGHDNVWNEDYHVVHHHAPNTHWTDAPAHFEAHREQYAAVTATIFRDTEEGQLLKWLFERNFDAMAAHFVDLDEKLSLEEKRSLLVRRLSVVCDEKGRDGKRVEWAATSSIREYEE